MTPFKVFGGAGTDLGNVHQLPPATFADFIKETLGHPVILNLTREQFHALPKDGKKRAKCVAYVTPAVFKTSPSKRVYECAESFCLVALDIDDPKQAAPFVKDPMLLEDALQGLNYAAYTTASSTSTEPRLRIFVQTAMMPTKMYAPAVKTVAARLGLPNVTKESLVCVQPMYLPTMFAGDNPETEHPLINGSYEGRPLQQSDLDTATVSASFLDASALEFLRPAIPEHTIEDTRKVLGKLDPDIPYPEWVEVAAALRHQHPNEPELSQAQELFDAWSARGDKYGGPDEIARVWNSVRETPAGRAPVTMRTLIAKAARKPQILKPNEIEVLLNRVRFDPNNPPPKEEWRFKIAGIEVSTPGNILVVSALTKTAKTSYLAAGFASTFPASAAAIKQSDGSPDYLGWESDGNPEKKFVLQFDTEQSPEQHFRTVTNGFRRAGIEQRPPWFSSWCLTGESPTNQLAAIIYAVEKRAIAGKIHSIWIDGIGDLVTSPNEETECYELIQKLRNLAISVGAPILCSLHFNPGTAKTRGHLGSELERKAQSVLTLTKEASGAVKVTMPLKSRGAPITDKEAIYFTWSEAEKLHVSIPPEIQVSRGPGAPSKYDLVAIIGEDTLSRDSLRERALSKGMSRQSFSRLFNQSVGHGSLVVAPNQLITAADYALLQ